jgi:hypothetical protein
MDFRLVQLDLELRSNPIGTVYYENDNSSTYMFNCIPSGGNGLENLALETNVYYSNNLDIS